MKMRWAVEVKIIKENYGGEGVYLTSPQESPEREIEEKKMEERNVAKNDKEREKKKFWRGARQCVTVLTSNNYITLVFPS